MKKEMFKVCALGIAVITLVTGCGHNEGETKKISKKSDENIVLESESNITSNKVESNITSNKKEEKDTTKGKVEKAFIDTKKDNDNYIHIFVNAVDKNNNSIWTKEIFKHVDKGGTDYNQLSSMQGKKYYYVIWEEKLDALDLQTGEVVWSSKGNEVGNFASFVESNDKLYIYSGTEYISIFDINTGKHIKSVGPVTKYLLKKDDRFDFETYYELVSSTINIKDNKLLMEVHDSDDWGHDTGFVGYLVLDLNTYELSFKK